MNRKAFSLFIFIFIFLPLCIKAIPVAADSAYMDGQYLKAIQMYEADIAKGVGDATSYYNLGNAYYKQGDTIRAILCYERSLSLDPSNADAKFNLGLCQNRMGISNPQNENPSLWASFTNFVAARTHSFWGWIAFGFAFVLLTLYTVKRFSSNRFWSRMSIVVIPLSIIMFVVFNVFAIISSIENNRINHYVMMNNTSLYSNPSTSSRSLGKILGGTTISVVEETQGGWKHIECPNGSKGWIKENIEPVSVDNN